MSVPVQAVVWDGTDVAVVDDVELRAPRPDEVVVEIEAAGLCRSDLAPMADSFPGALPVVLGHEAVGRVVDAGEPAGLLIGQRVVLSPITSCGRCRHCRSGSPTTCVDPPAPRPAPFSRRGSELHQFVRLGAFARRTIVDRTQIIPIPETVPSMSAALLGCAAITGVGAAQRRARVAAGDTVVVVGLGGIGLNVIQGARLAGATSIIACDTNPSKQRIARFVGATEFVLTPTSDDLAARLDELAAAGVDAAFDCVGRTEIIEVLVPRLGPGGRLVLVGLASPQALGEFAPRGLFADKAILGCRMGGVDPSEFIPHLVDLYLGGDLLLDELVTKVVLVAAVGELIDDLRAGRLDRGVLVFDGTGASA